MKNSSPFIPGMFDLILDKVQALNVEHINEMLLMAEQHGFQLERNLAATNRKTCRNFWRAWVSRGEGDIHELSLNNWKRLDPFTKWGLLDRCLSDGLCDLAMEMIQRGAPMNSLSTDGQHRDGPAAKLMANKYPKIDRDDCISLARVMLDRGAVSFFNPGSIFYSECVKEFLRYAPPPQDVQAWTSRMIWRAEDVLKEGGSALTFNIEAESVMLFARSGYPCDHVDLLAKACIAGRDDVAEMLVDWDEFDPGDVDREPSGWETGTPVVPRSFWHSLVGHWGWSVETARRNNYKPDPHWPGEGLCEKLLSLPWLSLEAPDPQGRTAIIRAVEHFGHLGSHPIEVMAAKMNRDKMLALAGVEESRQGSPAPKM